MISTTTFHGEKNLFNLQELEKISAISYKAFHIDEVESHLPVAIKIELLEYFSNYLIKLLKAKVVTSKEEKRSLIDLATKLKRQAETLEILSGKVRFEDLQIAAERMGKKAQSAVVQRGD